MRKDNQNQIQGIINKALQIVNDMDTSSLIIAVYQIYMIGGFFGKNLRGLDFYAHATTEYAEGTISGACISIVSISVLVVLVMSSISSLMTPTIMTDLIIDAKHSQDKLKVTIDIEFPSFPCGLLSVDIENVLRLHKTNIEEGLVKVRQPSGEVHNDKGWSNDQKLNEMRQQLERKEGCRIMGTFFIDRVPGNFHISMHGYNTEVHQLFMSGGLSKFDLSHRIHTLYFGDEEPRKQMQKTLNDFHSQKQIPDEFLGITYTYFLEIIEKNTIHSNNYHRESFYYTVRIHEVMMASVPMVMFRYQTNPMTQLQVGEYESWYAFFIEIVAIIGGIFTVSSIIDQIVHSSIHYLLKKGRMGKLA